MSSIYFQITSSGYRRTDRQPPSNTQNNRHLPVYRTVNEFMDLPNKQETQNKNGTEQESSGLGINLDSNNQKNENQLSKIKFVAINTQQQYIEHQTNSIQTDDFGNEQRKLEKSLTMSQRFPKLTAIPNPSKVSMKQYTSDAKTQKSTLNLQEPEHQSAYHELQKERILRQNLEKSYRGLLQRLEKNENSSKEDQEGWNFDEFSRKQKRHATQQPMTERINKCEFKELGKQRHKNMRSSCCNFKQVELDDETKKQELDLEEQNLHLVTQNELIHQRIYEDMQFLKTKLVGVENKMLQIELHQKEQELQNITKEVSEGTLSYCSEKHHLPNRQRVQYLFTILVMFLCMAIMSKK